MIPTIGIMIGFYVMTRCLDMVTVRIDGKPSALLSIMAAITVVMSVLAILTLLVSGASVNSLLQ